MKDWEVKKVNELYKQLDQLKQQNDRLQTQVDDLGRQNKQLQVYVNNTTGCGDSCDCGDIRSDLDEIKRLLTPAKTKRVTKKRS